MTDPRIAAALAEALRQFPGAYISPDKAEENAAAILAVLPDDWCGHQAVLHPKREEAEIVKNALVAERTEAGKRLAERYPITTGDIPAIEAEARAAVLRELEAEVEGLPVWDKRSVPGGFHVNRAAVLAAIDRRIAATTATPDPSSEAD